MGFWSGLAKVGGAIAAPFTAGASLAPALLASAPGVISGIGDMVGRSAGASAQSAASNRGVMAELLRDLYADREDAIIRRSQEGRLDRQEERAGIKQAEETARRAALLMALEGWEPELPSTIPRFNIVPDIGPQQSELAQLLYDQAVARLNEPRLPSPTPLSDYESLLADPELRELFTKQLSPGFWERVAGIGAIAAPILGEIYKQRDVEPVVIEEDNSSYETYF